MDSKAKHRGVIVPMVSPFEPDGAIDIKAVDKIVEYLITGGINGIFVLGTTGEGASIHADQRLLLVRSAVKAARSRVTMYAGISGNCLRESIEAAKQYSDLGIDAVVAHPPFCFALSDSDLEGYFSKLADASPLPLILYNMPKTTHVSIPLPVVSRLMEHPNIPAIKDSENNPDRILDLIRLASRDPGFSVLAGTAAVFAHALKSGGHGMVPGSGNLCPELYAGMYAAALAGRWDDVDRLHSETAAVTAQYQKPGALLGESLARLKSLMSDKGFCSPTMLPPLVTIGE